MGTKVCMHETNNVSIFNRMDVSMYVCKYEYLYVLYVSMYVCISGCMIECIYVSMYACINKCMYV